MKILYFNFHKNRIINENLNKGEGRRGARGREEGGMWDSICKRKSILKSHLHKVKKLTRSTLLKQRIKKKEIIRT